MAGCACASLAPLALELGDLGTLAWITACALVLATLLQVKNAVGERRERESRASGESELL